MRQRRDDPQVATLEEVWHGMKEDMRNAPKGLFELICSKDTYLILTLFVAIPAIYYTGTALLFDYLPSRLFGCREGIPGLDMTLGILILIIGGLIIWLKVNRVLSKKHFGQKNLSLLLKNSMNTCFEPKKEVSHGE